jgi:hypothetical protein
VRHLQRQQVARVIEEDVAVQADGASQIAL